MKEVGQKYLWFLGDKNLRQLIQHEGSDGEEDNQLLVDIFGDIHGKDITIKEHIDSFIDLFAAELKERERKIQNELESD